MNWAIWLDKKAHWGEKKILFSEWLDLFTNYFLFLFFGDMYTSNPLIFIMKYILPKQTNKHWSLILQVSMSLS